MKRLRVILLFGIPMILGTVGFMLAGEGLLQAMFMAIQLFLFENGDLPPNLAVELARWTAPLATATGVFMAIHQLRERMHRYWLYRKGNCTAVYGPEEEKTRVLEQLKGSGIDGGAEFVPAQRYILLGEEQENLQFYQMNRDALDGAAVYLKCSTLPAQAVAGANLHLYSPEEVAARLYWKSRCLYETVRDRDYCIDVVFVGFGKLGEELLRAALYNNVFHPKQKISYHIFGDDNGFMGVHPQLQKIRDSVQFYDCPWYEKTALLEQAARVIVPEQDNQLGLLRDLMLVLKRESVDVFSADGLGVQLFAEKERLHVFDWKQEAQKVEHIFGETLYARAKRINMRYVKLFASEGDVEETPENMEKEWAKLSAFHRYSNIRSADYHEVQREMLAAEGIGAVYDEIPMEWKERLSELEHISWCNYHYLHNWELGEQKHPQLRTHPDLIDYADLTARDKHKDLSNIQVLFGV